MCVRVRGRAMFLPKPPPSLGPRFLKPRPAWDVRSTTSRLMLAVICCMLLPILLYQHKSASSSALENSQVAVLPGKLVEGGAQKKNGEIHRIAVCVVGQLSRLQLDSLVTFFIQPNVARGHPVDVVVRLSDTSESTNAPDLAPGVWAGSSSQDIEDYLSQYARTVSARIEEPPLFQIRDSFIDASDKSYRTLEAKRDRHIGHLKQYHAVGLCMDQVEAWEASLGKKYDVILKVRDDSELQSQLVVKHKHKRTAYFLKCMSWGGLDDKHFLGGRRAAGLIMRRLMPDYLSRSLKELEYDQRGTTRVPRNIETYYSREAVLLDVPIAKVKADHLPFITVRNKSEGKCYKATRDCIPCAYFMKYDKLEDALDDLCPYWRTEESYPYHLNTWCRCKKSEDPICQRAEGAASDAANPNVGGEIAGDEEPYGIGASNGEVNGEGEGEEAYNNSDMGNGDTEDMVGEVSKRAERLGR
ncbi:unnamed protein product [Chrysoparadoxa australica]